VKQVEEVSGRKRYRSDLAVRDWQRLAPLLVVARRGKWPLIEVVNAILYGLLVTLTYFAGTVPFNQYFPVPLGISYV